MDQAESEQDSERQSSRMSQNNSRASGAQEGKRKKKAPAVRKVTDYLVHIEEVLGIGQYGKVCKAMKQEDKEKKIDKTYACKIIDIVQIS